MSLKKTVVLYYNTNHNQISYSIDFQENRLHEHCKFYNIKILKKFVDYEMNNNFKELPNWKKLRLYVKQNRSKIDYILFYEWNLYSKDMNLNYNMCIEFENIGVKVNTIKQPCFCEFDFNPQYYNELERGTEIENFDLKHLPF